MAVNMQIEVRNIISNYICTRVISMCSFESFSIQANPDNTTIVRTFSYFELSFKIQVDAVVNVSKP